MLLWCLAACGQSAPPAPELVAVEPAARVVGDGGAITAVGRHFHVRLSTDLSGATVADAGYAVVLLGDGPVELRRVARVDVNAVTGAVATETPPGAFGVVVTDPWGRQAELPRGAFTVLPQDVPGGGSCEVDDDCLGDPCVVTPLCSSGRCVYDRDGDGDGFIATTCGGLDCDDASDSVFPGQAEVQDDGVDQDCNGFDLVTCIEDADQDGFGTVAGTVVLADDGSCDLADREATSSDDCDDDGPCAAACAPNMVESDSANNCDDGYDNDCDEVVDQLDLGCVRSPVGIVRSVGPGETVALATGVDNLLSLVGGLARLAEPLPDRVGVGDALQYDSDDDGAVDAIGFVVARLSSTEYVIRSAAGDAPLALAGTDNDWSIFRAYTALSDAEEGAENAAVDDLVQDFDTWTEGRDLVAHNERWTIACYAGAVDGARATINGWTTDAEHTLRIYTPTAVNEVGTPQRHGGRWTGGAYTMVVAGRVLAVRDPHVRIEGLQLESTDTLSLGPALYVGAGNVELDSNIVRGPTVAGTGWAAIAGLAGGAVLVRNNVVYDVDDGIRGGSGDWYVYNNTVVNAGGVGLRAVLGTVTAKNNIVQQCAGGAFTGSFAADSNHNLSDDSNSTGGADDQTGVSLAFVDPGAGDFHLSAADAPAINTGGDLASDATAPFTHDIDGELRPPGAWDVGADER